MKQLLLLLATLLPLCGTTAQITHTAQGQQDRTAATLLQKAASKLANAAFNVSMTAFDAEGHQLSTQSAQVQYNKGRYRLVADGQELVCDGTTVWHYSSASNEVVISNMPDDDGLNLLNPASMLATYNNNFKAKYIRTDPDGTAVVDLQPRSAQSFHKLRLFIDERSGTLKRLEMFRYDASREAYTFSRHAYGRVGNNFTFDATKHPSAEVIDMR